MLGSGRGGICHPVSWAIPKSSGKWHLGLEGTMTVSFRPIQLGDRYRTARGWLVVAYGAVRGIVSEAPDGRLHYGFACDRRLQPEDGYKLFHDLQDARRWFDERLTHQTLPPRGRKIVHGRQHPI
jgi:hypothetical protein